MLILKRAYLELVTNLRLLKVKKEPNIKAYNKDLLKILKSKSRAAPKIII